MEHERERMEGVFRGRAGLAERYSLDNPGNRFNLDRLRSALDEALHTCSADLSTVRLLDLGCGELFFPELMTELGVTRRNIVGSDLLHWRLRAGHRQGRAIPAVTADASQLPLASGRFEIVSQLTMMTSVLDITMRQAIAGEMLRVLKPGGYIIWYDFRIDNPRNPHTRAIGKDEIRRLFTPLPATFRSLTLLPPLARKLRGSASGLLKFLSLVPMLRSHYLAVIGPKG